MVSNLLDLKLGENSDDPDAEQKWIVISFSAICGVVLIVCIVLIIVTTVRRHRRNHLRRESEDNQRNASQRRSDMRSLSKGRVSPKQSKMKDSRTNLAGYNFLTLSTVSEKSNEATATITSSVVPLDQTLNRRSGNSVHYLT